MHTFTDQHDRDLQSLQKENKLTLAPIVPSFTIMSPGWKTSYSSFVTTSDTKLGSACVKNGTEATKALQLKLTIS